MSKFEQENSWGCGPASLVWACALLGLEVTQEEVARLAETTANWGTTHTQMIHAAMQLGLSTIASPDMNLTYLMVMRRLKWQVIVNWLAGDNETEDGHYSLFDRADKGIVYLNDPTDGKQTQMATKYFQDRWWDIDERVHVVRNWALMVKRR